MGVSLRKVLRRASVIAKQRQAQGNLPQVTYKRGGLVGRIAGKIERAKAIAQENPANQTQGRNTLG